MQPELLLGERPKQLELPSDEEVADQGVGKQGDEVGHCFLAVQYEYGDENEYGGYH